MDPTPGRWGPFWTPITPEAGSLFHAAQHADRIADGLEFVRIVGVDIAAQEPISGFQIDVLGSPHQATSFYQTPNHMGGFEIRFPRPWPRLDLVIVGGESGTGARPTDEAWIRSLKDQCQDAGTAFFIKQLSSGRPKPIKDIAEFPKDLQVREMPHA